MGLFKTIDWLLIGAVYLFWAIAVAGVVGSVLLFAANLSLGLSSAMVFAAAFLLSVGVVLLLMPKSFVKHMKGMLNDKQRYIAGAVLLVLAAAIMGIVYFSTGGFPALNLVFI